MATSQFKRAPSIPKKISDINPEKDIRVRIFGRIIDKNDGSFIIDDGSSKAEIVAEAGDFDVGDTVRVLTRVLPLEEGYELRAEAVQDMSKMDIDLYKKVFN
jgi:hypothetical protein